MTSALRLPRIRVRFKKPKPPHPFWFLCLLIALYAAFEIVFNVLQWDASSPAYIAQGGLIMAYIWPGLRSPSRPHCRRLPICRRTARRACGRSRDRRYHRIVSKAVGIRVELWREIRDAFIAYWVNLG